MSKTFQNQLAKKLNLYQKANERELLFKDGYCHGLTLLWLYKMDEGKESWFYDLCDQLIKIEAFNFKQELTNVEKLIQHIEWLQNPNHYLKEAHQSTIEKLIEVPREFALSYLFDDAQLKEALEVAIKENKMICFSSLDHTIGIYKRENNIYLFDANYKNFPPFKVCSNIDELQEEIVACFEEDEDEDENKDKDEEEVMNNRYAFIINIFKKQPAKKTQEKLNLFRKFSCETNSISMLNKEQATNLYLACDNLDEDAVAVLLKKGADPNQVSYKKMSPIQLAVDRNDLKIAAALIKRVDQIDQIDTKGETNLICAIKQRHEKMVELLLKNGANPLKKDRCSQSPFELAFKLKEWPIIIQLLRYTKNTKSLKNSVDFLLYRKEIIEAAKQQWHSLSLKNKADLKKKLDSLFNMSAKPTFFKHKKKELLQASPFSLPYSLRSHIKV